MAEPIDSRPPGLKQSAPEGPLRGKLGQPIAAAGTAAQGRETAIRDKICYLGPSQGWSDLSSVLSPQEIALNGSGQDAEDNLRGESSPSANY
jgi:hypothetical protein